MFDLWDYQEKLINDIANAWATLGIINVLAVSATGSGKTVVFSTIAHRFNGVSIAIAHRHELVSQISLALARNGVYHSILAQNAVIRACVQIHRQELGQSFYSANAACIVAGVDTLIRMDPNTPIFKRVGLWILDEAHHLLKNNKWGRAVKMFPNARGLGVTATPCRSDGRGLGRHVDGLFDTMVLAPTMRDIINRGFLTDYKIFSPASDIDTSTLPIGASGDFSLDPLRKAVHKSHIVGDVVDHYLRIAPGMLGITFCVDIESANKQAAAFRQAGVPAEMVSGESSIEHRHAMIQKFRRGDIKQLVNVDLFGEGFDLPAISVVSMGRPTWSFGLYCLDPETEILTPAGWKGPSELHLIDEVIAFDSADSTTRSVQINDNGKIKRNLYPNEIMYGIDAPHLDIRVSDRHDMVVKSRTGTAKNWQKQKACDVAKRAAMFIIPVAGFGEFEGAKLTDDELRLLGWFLSDGCINKRTNGLAITQAYSKTAHIDSIRNALIGCGFKFSEAIRHRKDVPATHQSVVQFTVSKGAPRGRDKHLTGWGRLSEWMDKSIPPCYDTLTREQFLILLETFNLGDGVNNHSSLDYIKHTLTITCGDNLHMADRIQALCITRGLRCNIAHPHYHGHVKWAILHIRDSVTSTIAGHGNADGSISGKKRYARSRFEKKTNRPAFVWCITNELGTLITRRNGKVAVVGNCQQFGRALRKLEGKKCGILIDHVGNVHRHGLPDAPQNWTLDRRERSGRSATVELVKVRTCPDCTGTYDRSLGMTCPYCQVTATPATRSAPAHVDGCLFELDPETLALMRGEIETVQSGPKIPYGATPEIIGALKKHHRARLEALDALKHSMAMWASGMDDIPRAQRRFYLEFGIDVATAQTLSRADADKLRERIEGAK